jgi:predicted nucleic acid-binding protein
MGVIHLDAGVVIGLLDAGDAHHQSSAQALAAALQSGDRLAMAASAFAECLVGPSRRGEPAVATVCSMFERLPINVVDLDVDIARRAAALRARHASLRLPDALVLATAAERSSDRLITTDRRWPTARKLGVSFTIAVLT